MTSPMIRFQMTLLRYYKLTPSKLSNFVAKIMKKLKILVVGCWAISHKNQLVDKVLESFKNLVKKTESQE